ncbi:MAG: hypothetical protein AB1348_01960 [Nitrospirota bacterium]
MTQNEKKVLMKFKEIRQGNTVTIAGTLRVTIGYAYDVCKKLCEKGYLERLSPGRFALYRITSLGEEQVRTKGQIKEEEAIKPIESSWDKLREGVLPPASSIVEGKDSGSGKGEEYECANCGTVVREDEIECPKCGAVFEGIEEEEVTVGSVEEQSPEQTEQVVGQSSKGVTEQKKASFNENIDEKAGILNHPSVPEDWKACNWKWK